MCSVRDGFYQGWVGGRCGKECGRKNTLQGVEKAVSVMEYVSDNTRKDKRQDDKDSADVQARKLNRRSRCGKRSLEIMTVDQLSHGLVGSIFQGIAKL